jgi:hypothetical protein
VNGLFLVDSYFYDFILFIFAVYQLNWHEAHHVGATVMGGVRRQIIVDSVRVMAVTMVDVEAVVGLNVLIIGSLLKICRLVLVGRFVVFRFY